MDPREAGIPVTHHFAESQKRARAAGTAGRTTPPGGTPVDAIQKIPAEKRREAVESAVASVTDARRLFLDAAKDLDSIGETAGHRHLMALMASADDCVDALVRDEQQS